MKKILWLLILFLPFWVFAYSEYIIPGGDTLGIEVNSKGVIVVGFYEVNGKRINDMLRIGDRIVEINNIELVDVRDLTSLISENISNNSLNISYIRNNKLYEDVLEVIENNGDYKTGLYVKSNVLGIGTLTYIDPNSRVYGVLGHPKHFLRSCLK